MELPRETTPVGKCLSLALYSQTLLQEFSDSELLRGLAQTLVSAATPLEAAQREYRDAVQQIVVARTRVKLADYRADRIVRRVSHAVEGEDGGKGGRIAAAVFPSGLNPVVRPVGTTQVDELRKLEGLLEAQAGRWPGATEQMAAVAEARTFYEQALTARAEATQRSAGLRAQRDMAKEDFLDVYATVAGRIRAEYPRDRDTQDLFFDAVSRRRRGSSPDTDDDEEDDAA